MKPWVTSSRVTILNHSKWLIVENHSILLPDGETIDNWPWIITPDYVIVVAVNKSGEFLCFHQTKYAINGTTYAPVGGYIEAGENPQKAAKRELLEETGYVSSNWTHLGSFRVDGNHGCGTAHLFLAKNVTFQQEPDCDDLEDMQLMFLTQERIESLILSEEFKVLPWTTAILLAFHYLKTDRKIS
jgi:ADP-ribose pyrophosphatase